MKRTVNGQAFSFVQFELHSEINLDKLKNYSINGSKWLDNTLNQIYITVNKFSQDSLPWIQTKKITCHMVYLCLDLKIFEPHMTDFTSVEISGTWNSSPVDSHMHIKPSKLLMRNPPIINGLFRVRYMSMVTVINLVAIFPIKS